jgi:hypothetical protein
MQEATGAEGSEVDQSQLIIMEEMKRLIRLKHYSYSAERTYLDWVKRFFVYVGVNPTFVQPGIKLIEKPYHLKAL